MRHDLVIKLRTQHDLVLAFPRQRLLPRVSCIPNPCLAHEIEASLMDYGSFGPLGVGAEKDGGAEDSLKGSHQVSVLGTALLQAERIEHFRAAPECDPLPLGDR